MRKHAGASHLIRNVLQAFDECAILTVHLMAMLMVYVLDTRSVCCACRLAPVELHSFTRKRRGLGAFDEVGTGSGASVADTAAMNAAFPQRSVLVLRIAYNGVDPAYCDEFCVAQNM